MNFFLLTSAKLFIQFNKKLLSEQFDLRNDVREQKCIRCYYKVVIHKSFMIQML